MGAAASVAKLACARGWSARRLAQALTHAAAASAATPAAAATPLAPVGPDFARRLRRIRGRALDISAVVFLRAALGATAIASGALRESIAAAAALAVAVAVPVAPVPAAPAIPVTRAPVAAPLAALTACALGVAPLAGVLAAPVATLNVIAVRAAGGRRTRGRVRRLGGGLQARRRACA